MANKPITRAQFDTMVKTDDGVGGWELHYNGITNIVIERDNQRWRVWSTWEGVRCDFLRDTTPPPILIQNSYEFNQFFRKAEKKSRPNVKQPWFNMEENGMVWRFRMSPSQNIEHELVTA